jgi:hypothetical protein
LDGQAHERADGHERSQSPEYPIPRQIDGHHAALVDAPLPPSMIARKRSNSFTLAK